MGEINVTPEFVLAGEATFTVSNGKGDHRTYHVYKAKPSTTFPGPTWFIKMLTGPDNQNVADYKYVGRVIPMLQHTCSIKMTAMSKFRENTLPVTVARWALRAIWQTKYRNYQLPDGYSIKHDGKCGRCGAKLTNPASLDTGLGPECAEKAGVEWSERSSQSAFPEATR